MSPASTPIVSRVLANGTLIETIYDAREAVTMLAVSLPDGTCSIEPHIDLADGTRLIPYSPQNNLIASGCVLLPSSIGDVGDVGDLVGAIRRYLARYVEFSPAFFELAPYYILLSWSYDRFREVPLLRLSGEWGSGKTRGLLTLGSIAYKPFFASGASTVSPIFHILDGVRGSLVLDECDFRYSDMTGELVKVLNNGTVDGLPVLRTMTNRHKELNPTAFRVFGPKLLAMREAFQDPALESRCITERMVRRQLSPGIPIHTPEALHTEAQELRNRLLAWRLTEWHRIAPRAERAIAGADPRTNQMALALLSLVDDNGERERIVGFLSSQGSGRHAAHLRSPEIRILTAIRDALEVGSGPYIPVAEVAARFNEAIVEAGDLPMTNKWIGAAIRRLGIPTAKSSGIYGIPITERSRITALADRLGLPSIAGDGQPIACQPSAS